MIHPAQRDLIHNIQLAALSAVEPASAVRRCVRLEQSTLWIEQTPYNFGAFERIFLLGAGKAAAPMAAALLDLLGERLTHAVVVTKHGYAAPNLGGSMPGLKILQASHPIPDRTGVEAAGEIAALAAKASAQDLVLCLISGGASALLTLPTTNVSLNDLQRLTDQLLRCGATINELNAVRKHLSQIKGGGLARLAAPARVVGLVLSDVVGDPLDVIASGPISPDPTTFADAWGVLTKYDLQARAPAAIRAHLQAGLAGKIPETPKPGDPIFRQVQSVIIGSNRLAAKAACQRAQNSGFDALVLSTFVEGEARQVARVAASLLKQVAYYNQPLARPACLILGGETTVTVRGAGKGGRNQELALAAALALEGLPGVALLALATDGTDGPTDAAGALVTGQTIARAHAQGLDPAAALADNDAYHFFQALGDLVITGPTQTNVNDLTFLFAF